MHPAREQAGIHVPDPACRHSRKGNAWGQLKGYGLYGDIELSAVENSGLRKSIFLTSADEYNQLNNLISDHVKSSKKRAIMDYISFRKMG